MTNDNVAVTSNVRDAVTLMLLGDAGEKEKGGSAVCVDVRAARGKGDVVGERRGVGVYDARKKI